VERPVVVEVGVVVRIYLHFHFAHSSRTRWGTR
jgi:hypothetical protein